MRDALRFVPDVILIGEIRDSPTMVAAVRAAISGHLVLTTMHAPTTVDAIRKMIALLQGSQAEIQSLASCLVGVIAQALVPDKRESGLNHLAFEFLHCRDNRVSETIAAGAADSTGQRLAQLEQQVRNKELNGSVQPMLQSLMALVGEGKVDARHASAVAVHPEDKKHLAKAGEDKPVPTPGMGGFRSHGSAGGPTFARKS